MSVFGFLEGRDITVGLLIAIWGVRWVKDGGMGKTWYAFTGQMVVK